MDKRGKKRERYTPACPLTDIIVPPFSVKAMTPVFVHGFYIAYKTNIPFDI